MTRAALREVCVLALLVLILLVGAPRALVPALAEPPDALGRLEAEFRRVSERALRAAVVVEPRSAAGGVPGSSSGVVIHPDGWVLSDGDAGLVVRRVGGEAQKSWSDAVTVRAVEPDGKARLWPARVVRRDRGADTSLLQLDQGAAAGLGWVEVGDSERLRPGAFLVVAGTAFDETGHAPPCVTVGVLASTDPSPDPAEMGRYANLYTTAAINQGVNGGPVLDLDGRLVGTVATWVDPEPEAAHQFLGRIVPVERIRRALATGPARSALAPRPTSPSSEASPGAALEDAIRDAAASARPALVSLEVRRRRRVASVSPTGDPALSLPRYQGPVSGVLISPQGEILTSLYNLTNVGELVFPLWRPAPGESVAEGLADVELVEAHLLGGAHGPARVVAHDERLGLVLLSVGPALVQSSRALPLEAAPRRSHDAGRFVVGLGAPFGGARDGAALLTFGILSKLHAARTPAPWRGQWQTDAAVTDANCGGPAVDLDGRLLGLLQLWHPARHGRGSGVGFVVPWPRIEESLALLRTGRGPERGYLGVRFVARGAARIEAVDVGGPADRAGIRAGDVVHRVEGEDVADVEEVVAAIRMHFAGEEITLTLEREGALRSVPVRLGVREP